MLRVRNLALRPDEDRPEKLKRAAAAALGIAPGELRRIVPVRRSIDARKRDRLRILYTVDVETEREDELLRLLPDGVAATPEARYCPPSPQREPERRPVVAGFGPAGMFIALTLAEAGLRPVVLERGRPVEERQAAVRLFRERGILDPESNVQFGEGGAGTFSDGKLNTGIGGSEAAWVLERLAELGAQKRILWDALPHVGTDVLTLVVKNVRERILSLGGELRYSARLSDLELSDGGVAGAVIETEGGPETLPCGALFLAVGHSARDTFEMLLHRGVPMEAKPFAMGVRIEHLQREIDRTQYGRWAGHPALGAAPYRLSVHLPDGTGVYTFCMCPGGYVMAAASEAGGVVTNGMSYSGRAGENANSALLVSLPVERFPHPGALGGMVWQRSLEREAFRLGGEGYAAPAQKLGDFMDRQPGGSWGRVKPSYLPDVRRCGLDQLLPEALTRPLREAIPLLGRRLSGFDDRDAVLTAPETRSSSPVRILRGGDRQAPGFPGLYPCGEGAGWSGGIVSSAVDGLKSAAVYIESLR
ncbi:MAG: hypothetical protein IKP17_07925 [Oscillospiraceae bacterium]|nr:hypothetical protein [Oscillospiraceae bacterium]MBR4692672.1 hypothetical protein [Oscillospiraceae bacterium]